MGKLLGSLIKILLMVLAVELTSFGSIRTELQEEVKAPLKRIKDVSYQYDGEDRKIKIYEDETNIYYFIQPINDYVTVVYEDDSTQCVPEALRDGRIVPEDLEYYGVEYCTESKKVDNIVNMASEYGIATACALGWFYSDDRFSYCFPSLESEYIIVHFKDGTEQNFVEALNEGKVIVRDLEQFGIQYYAQKHGKSNYINHPGK
jgi:hypothetical protein